MISSFSCSRLLTGAHRMDGKNMLKSFLAIAGIILAVLLIVQPEVNAQSRFATVSGTVRDSSGGAVRGATVTIKNADSGETRLTETNGDGFFAAPTIPAGTYTVTVEMKGFEKWVGNGIVLNSDDSRTLQIDLKVGAVTDSVVVESSVTELAVVDSGEKSALISQKELQQLSLVSRNASEFIKLLPGAQLSPTNGKNQSNFGGQVVGINGFVPNGTNAGGLSAANINGQSLNITQDGQNVFDPGAAGNATPINPNPEMISEVKVLTSNFTAENPQGPVVVNTVTKGGGSAFHGSGYLDVRNSAMNAADHFNKEQVVGHTSSGAAIYPPGFNPKPDSSYYYPGGTIGGPVIIPGTNFNKSRQKLFFFEAYENYHQNPDAGVERAFVPTADMLNGDFSALKTTSGVGRFAMGTVPTTPNTTDPKATKWVAGMAQRPGCAITGGVMNSGCIDPNGQILLKDYFPLPNIPLSEIGSTGGFNYIVNSNAQQNSWQNVIRSDWTISANTTAYVSWSRQRETATMPYGLWNGACDWCVPSPSPVVGNNGSDFVTASLVHVFSPTMTSESRFGYTKISFPTTPTNPAKLLRKDAGYPLTGIFGNPMMPAEVTWGQSLPNSGDIGHDYHPTMIADKGIPSFSQNLTKVFGTHTAKLGFFWQHTYNTQDNWGQYMGAISPSPWDSPTGNNYADMLMGMGTGYYETALPPATSIAQNIYSVYAQDDWKVTRRLTVQYGLRFEHYGKPYAPVNNVGIAIFDPSKYIAASGPDANTGIAWHKMDPSIPLSGTESRFLYFSPRVGAAYDLFGTGRTVIRGGWGRYRSYDSVQSNSYTGPAGTAFGSVSWSCGSHDPACATWETIDLSARPSPVNYGQSGLGPGLKDVSVSDPRNDEQPLVTTYSVSIDQRLPWKLSTEFSYVGNTGKYFQIQPNINAVPFMALLQPSVTCDITQQACQQPQRRYSNYHNLTGSETGGKSRYDGFQVSVKRSYGWVSTQVNYTWAKTMGTTGAPQATALTGALPNYGTDWAYGVSNLNRPHVLSASYVFSLPNMKSGNSIVRGAANGWQISGITQVESGQMIVNSAPSANFSLTQGGTNQDNTHLLGTPDIVIYPVLLCNPTSGLAKGYYANPNCFGPQPKGKLGNAGMPYIGGPLFWTSDLKVTKIFRISERQSLEFQASAFNFMNHGLTSFTQSDSNLSLSFNDFAQPITGAKMLYPGNGLPEGDPNRTTDQVMGCVGTTIGQKINGVTYPTGIKCTGTSTFGEATHHVGNRLMAFGIKYSF